MYNFSFTTTRSPRGKKSKIYQVLNIKRGIIERLIKWMIIKIYKQEKKKIFYYSNNLFCIDDEFVILYFLCLFGDLFTIIHSVH